MSFTAPLSTPTFLKEKIFSELQDQNPKPFSFSAGQMLRKAREARHLTLDDVSQRLCLSRSILEALEEGRYQELSQGEAYVTGFVRSYASLVGIDPRRVILQMKEELPPCENPPELIFPVPLPPTGHPKKLALLFSIVVTLGGVFFGQEFLVKKHVSDLLSYPPPFVPVQVTTAQPKDAQSLAQTHPPKIEKITPDPSSSSSSLTAEKPGFFSLIESSAPDVVPPPPSLPPAVVLDSIEAVSTSAALVLEATEKSWVEVRDNQGNLHISKIMQPGEVYKVPGDASLLLSTGNMGGLRIHHGKQVISTLGKSGAVCRKIPLTFTALKKVSKDEL